MDSASPALLPLSKGCLCNAHNVLLYSQVIIIMVIFKHYFSREHIALPLKKRSKLALCKQAAVSSIK